ncbi:hypothetical protein RSAG8_10859, partial [Rhizoctonia solani AG-8 WAC10335]
MRPLNALNHQLPALEVLDVSNTLIHHLSAPEYQAVFASTILYLISDATDTLAQI